jgi:thioredoxin 1
MSTPGAGRLFRTETVPDDAGNSDGERLFVGAVSKKLLGVVSRTPEPLVSQSFATFPENAHRKVWRLKMAGANTLTFTDSAWDADVLKSETPVLVDFWAEWCGPCRMIAPTVDAVADEFSGKLKVGKLNVDDNGGTAMRYNVRGIPTLLLFKGGQVVEQRVGAVSKGDLVKMVEAHVG